MKVSPHGAEGKWPWPGMVFALLGLQILLCLVAIGLAARAPGGEVVPDYHRKALEWDRRNGTTGVERRG